MRILVLDISLCFPSKSMHVIFNFINETSFPNMNYVNIISVKIMQLNGNIRGLTVVR